MWSKFKMDLTQFKNLKNKCILTQLFICFYIDSINCVKWSPDLHQGSADFYHMYNRYIHQRNRAYRAERALRECYANGGMLTYWWDQITARYEKWKNKIHDAQQLILNLNQQIINLQNNLLNMAAVVGIQDVILTLASILGQISQYIRQESLDDYVNKIIQIFKYGDALSIGAFDAVQIQILLLKIARKYIPPNPFNNQI